MTDIVLTAQEKANLYFIPQAPGGRVVTEEMQQRLQDLGLITAPLIGGLRRITVLGDRVRLGTTRVTVKD